MTTPAFSLLPLGGCGEFGANATLLFAGDAASGPAVLIDAGARFAGPELPGVDLVLPDLDFIAELGDRLVGCVLTHGHEDHIAALPYLLRRLRVPIYAPAYCLSQLRARLDEFGLTPVAQHPLRPGEVTTLGPFELEPIAISHSIPEAVAIALRVNGALTLFSGDFRIETDPIWGWATDTERLSRLGDEGVALLFADSTGADVEGDNPGERSVRAPLREAIESAPARVIVTTFASHTVRLRQLLELAVACGRRVVLIGRSAHNHLALGRAAGVIEVPPGLLVDEAKARDLPPDQLLIIATGCQGERRAALPRMAAGARELPPIEYRDRVIYSARIIPGNEMAVQRTANMLVRRGAEIVWGDRGVHVSGHGTRGDLRRLIELTRPALFVPAHGDAVHLRAHAALAEEVGVAHDRIALIENGHPLEVLGEQDRWRPRFGPPYELSRVLAEEGRELHEGEALMFERRRVAARGALCAAFTIADQGRAVGPVRLRASGFDTHGLAGPMAEAQHEADASLRKLSAEERRDPEVLDQTVRRALRRAFRRSGVRSPEIVVVPTSPTSDN